MKTFFYFFLIVLVSFLLFQSFRSINKIQDQKIFIKAQSDTMRYVNGVNKYYANLLKFAMKNSNSPLFKGDAKVYNITEDTAKSVLVNHSFLFAKTSRSLVLRYTEIGCNECSTLTIKKMKALHLHHPDLPIYIFVDFTNYDSYLQWRKVDEVDFPVFYLKKGSIAFDKDSSEYSYLFLVDNKETASDFFVPNSGFPELLDYYIKNIYK